MDYENAVTNSPANLHGQGVRLLPTPSPTIHLKTLDDIRVEMAKVYRDMKTGKVPAQDGTRLAYVLAQIGRVIEIDKFSGRVEAVERVLKLRSSNEN